MESRLKGLGWKLVDVLFPPSCAGCGTWGSKYCAECLENTRIITPPICKICGEPGKDGAPAVCGRCSREKMDFYAARAWAHFKSPLKEAIHKLKYQNDIGLAGAFAEHLRDILERSRWEVDLIVPVPLDDQRQKERGYNQSTLLSRTLSAEAGLPHKERALIRVKHTHSQVGLTQEERKENVREAFAADREFVNGKTILVVDDVMTTGATLNACSWALISAGAEKVYAITLARSVYPG